MDFQLPVTNYQLLIVSTDLKIILFNKGASQRENEWEDLLAFTYNFLLIELSV